MPRIGDKHTRVFSSRKRAREKIGEEGEMKEIYREEYSQDDF